MGAEPEPAISRWLPAAQRATTMVPTESRPVRTTRPNSPHGERSRRGLYRPHAAVTVTAMGTAKSTSVDRTHSEAEAGKGSPKNNARRANAAAQAAATAAASMPANSDTKS